MTGSNIVLSIIYGILAVLILRRKQHFRYPLLQTFLAVNVVCQVAVPLPDQIYNALSVAHVVVVGECIWLAVRNQRAREIADLTALCGGTIGLTIAGAWGGDWLAIAKAAALMMLISVAASDWLLPFACPTSARAHLRLQCAWLAARVAASWSYGFYQSESTWLLVRWAYAAALAVIAAGYLIWFDDRRRRFFLQPIQQR